MINDNIINDSTDLSIEFRVMVKHYYFIGMILVIVVLF